MRLICPNCDAEYEVDDAAIPREGRDVQCSACGHAWFQEHPEVEAAREAEAALYEPPEGAAAAGAAAATPAPEVVPAAETTPEPEMAPEPEAAPAPAVRSVAEPVAAVTPEEDEDEAPQAVPVAPAEPAPPPRARSLDEAVLSVLREEAEREQAARRAEAAAQPVLESQTEMPLAQSAASAMMPAAVRRIAEMRGLTRGPDQTPEPAEAMAPAEAPVAMESPAGKGRKGSHVFPAIEEINSTLRAASDRAQDAEDVVAGTMPETRARRGAFRRGFVTLVSLAVIIVALYMLAPVIAAQVPALEGAARAYVAAVDAARIWLDGSLRGLVEMLQGLAGDQQG